MKHTIWAKIPGTYNWVSLDGNIYSNSERPGILKGRISNWGYLRVAILYKEGYKQMRVHRLVLSMFKPNPENLPQVNHKDGNKLNNVYENLEWSTNSRNQEHAWSTGLQKANTSPKPTLHALTKIQRQEVKALSASGMSYIKISKLYGCSNGTIRRICLDLLKYD